jgi:hypothetical protein
VDGSVVWFGSDNGITMYDKKAGKWVTFTVEDRLPSNRITCIAGSANAVWFGTFDAGLIKYDRKSGDWHSYSRKDGLAHDCVLSVSVDGDIIWIGTRRGLNRYDISKNNWTTFTEFGDSEDELDMVAKSEREDLGRARIEAEDSGSVGSYLRIAKINSNPPGRDEEDLNGEWVKIVNTTDSDVDMAGFALSDYAGHEYKFGKLVLARGASVKVLTGSGTNTVSSVYWGSKTPIWNNRGDTAYLRDAYGKVMDVYSY